MSEILSPIPRKFTEIRRNLIIRINTIPNNLNALCVSEQLLSNKKKLFRTIFESRKRKEMDS